MIGYVMSYENNAGYLENLHTGLPVEKQDLHTIDSEPVSKTKKSCLLRHLTDHLCDGTCHVSGGGKDSNVFNIPDNMDFKSLGNNNTTCSCCAPNINVNNISGKIINKNNKTNKKINIGGVFINNITEELQRPSSYPPVPKGVLNKIPTAPEQEGKISTEEKLFTVDDINLEHLNNSKQKQVRKMLRPFDSMWSGELGTVKLGEHRIDTDPNARPYRSQPYRAGLNDREIQRYEVQRQLKLGVIKPSTSEWASTVLLVPKPDGTKRFCVDYRKLNSLTIKGSYPLPKMDECLDSLGDANFFTTLDANCGYWQLNLREEDRHKTAFVCHEGCFEYLRMAFGLCNAPASFQRTMDMVLNGYRWKTCLVYLDDVIIFSKNFDDHLKHVQEILQCLRDAGFSLKLKKCDFFQNKVNYLGHVIMPGKLLVAQKTVDAVKGFKLPETQTHIKSFLGLCNVYRRFVPDFTRIAKPLNMLLKKGQPTKLLPLTDEQIEAFNALKNALINAPILSLPRAGFPYSIDTDACDYQIGVALLQHHEDGTRHPIGYWSRSLNSAERNYSATERECLAVVWACQILRPYLEGSTFQIYSDHEALKWLLGITDVSGRLARWRLRLAEFDYTIEYKKGKKPNSRCSLPSTHYW